MKIGITGHQQIKNVSDWAKIESSIEAKIKSFKPPIIGLTSMAKGADQIFAKVIIRNSGSLWAILPFKNYDSVFEDPKDRTEYNQLLNKANKVEILELNKEKEICYMEAGKRIVDLSDCMIAVWDGKKAVGFGGTGDVVAYAKSVGKQVIQIDVK